ncbi:hypothetical protein V2G26_019194 [Clonostachys chloroleuca]
MYQVYLVEYLGAPRNHHAIFVETDADGSGQIFHVKGDIQNGMTYESKAGRKPETSASFVSKSPIGQIDESGRSRIDGILRGIPPPKKQFNGPKRLYPREPLRRCQEWTREAIQALRSEGVLHD